MDSRLYRAFAQNSAEMPAAEHLPYIPGGYNQVLSDLTKPDHRNGVNPPPRTQTATDKDDPRIVSLWNALKNWSGLVGNANELQQGDSLGIDMRERYPRR